MDFKEEKKNATENADIELTDSYLPDVAGGYMSIKVVCKNKHGMSQEFFGYDDDVEGAKKLNEIKAKGGYSELEVNRWN